MRVRLLVTWLVFCFAGAAAVSSSHVPDLPWLLAATTLWGALCAAGTRSALLLGGARKGAARVDDSAPPHRLWRGGLLALLAGATVGGIVGGGATLFGGGPASWLGWSALFLGVTALAFPAGAALGARALSRPRSRRPSTTLAWIVVDTALPAGVLAAVAGAVIARLRYGDLEHVSAVETSRHLAVSLLLYGALLGVAGGLKTAREKLGGLVDAPTPSVHPPGAIATGATLGLIVLVVGPHVLDAVPLDALVVVKAALGLVVGSALCALGALAGARR